jgi:hypothetical protein
MNDEVDIDELLAMPEAASAKPAGSRDDPDGLGRTGRYQRVEELLAPEVIFPPESYRDD